MNAINPGSDPIYKRLYSFPEMVADLLHSVLPAEALGAVDLDSLDKVPAAYVGDDFRARHSRGGCHRDTVWRVRRADADSEGTHMLVLLEFQSSSDATMALRVLEYTTMLQRILLRAKAVEAGKLPPVVLYNGESPWSAAHDVRELFATPGPALAAYQPAHKSTSGTTRWTMRGS